MLTGATGRLGPYLIAQAERVGLRVEAWCCSPHAKTHESRAVSVDVSDRAALEARIDLVRPRAVLHAAAISEVALCHADPALAERVNHEAARQVADVCAARAIRLVSVSTDMVFDGERAPYAEGDAPEPACVYGATKRRGEVAVLRHPGHLVARLALMYGPRLGARASFFDTLVTHLREGRAMRLFADEWRGMLSMRAASQALVELTQIACEGVVHLAGERMSRYDLGLRTAEALGLPAACLSPGSRSEHTGPEPRQRDLTLSCARLRQILPTWSAGDFSHEVERMLEQAGHVS